MPNSSTNKSELPFAQELQQTLENGLEQYGGKGISAAVIVPGYEMWSGVSGVSYESVLIKTDTLFSAGSINKMYTAVTILQLAEEGVLSLEDPINKWLPEYPLVDGSITIRQLLNHTGGVFDMVRHPDYWGAMLEDTNRVWAPEEIIKNFLLEPYFPKGTDWHYSTPGYILLRMIIKEATGMEVVSAYRERLFTPLGLKHTYVAGQEELPGNTSHGWFDTDGDGTYDDLPSFTSFNSGIGGAVYATPEDLALWSHALFSEDRLLNENSFEQMLTFHSPTPGKPLVVGYGLGVVKFNPELFNGLEIWGHSGNAPGYAATCFYLPEYDVSIGMTVNTEAGEAMPTIVAVLTLITTHVEKKTIDKMTVERTPMYNNEEELAKGQRVIATRSLFPNNIAAAGDASYHAFESRFGVAQVTVILTGLGLITLGFAIASKKSRSRKGNLS